MPSGPDGDAFLALLERLRDLQTAATVADALDAAVLAGCAATDSPRGLAGLFDGVAATSDRWYDVDAGWTPARLRWELDRGAPGRVCYSGTPLVANDVPESTTTVPEATEVLGVARFVCVPLPGEAGGVMGFLEAGGRSAGYGSPDVRRLAVVAAMAADRLRVLAGGDSRRAEMHAAQGDIAERLQRRLLPAAPPQLPGLDIAFTYRSASSGVLSGGDFVDFYSRSPHSLAFAIGDVAGKGVEAMAVTFVTKYILQAAVHGGQLSWPTNPGEALQELRTGLLEQPDFDAGSERFVTVLFGQLNVRRGLLLLASAGHPTPFVLRASGVERPLLLTEPAIGVDLGAALSPYPVEALSLQRGDALVLFTDGISELRDDDGTFFEERLPELLGDCHDLPADEVVDGVMAAAERFAARPPADDLALLCIRLTAEVT
jgi:serine phosphatase RsbU (regulator of sigma subunit)